MTHSCHLSAGIWPGTERGTFCIVDHWINPVLSGLGNWKQWVSNIDPTDLLTSLGLSDFNYKIQLAGQMLLGIVVLMSQ